MITAMGPKYSVASNSIACLAAPFGFFEGSVLDACSVLLTAVAGLISLIPRNSNSALDDGNEASISLLRKTPGAKVQRPALILKIFSKAAGPVD
jgi:hypothetical protein